jgi:hypothetical protein
MRNLDFSPGGNRELLVMFKQQRVRVSSECWKESLGVVCGSETRGRAEARAGAQPRQEQDRQKEVEIQGIQEGRASTWTQTGH